MTERETEIKLILSPDGAEKLSSILGDPSKERVLVNQYYVPQGKVERRDWVLRLRAEGDKSTLTLKIGREVAPGLFDAVEISEQVNGLEPEGWESTAALQRFREEISRAPLQLLGQTSTQRRVFPAPIEIGRLWELDQTVYPDGGVVWELEVELPNQQKQQSMVANLSEALREWLQQRGVESSLGRKTKYARFLDSLLQAELES